MKTLQNKKKTTLPPLKNRNDNDKASKATQPSTTRTRGNERHQQQQIGGLKINTMNSMTVGQNNQTEERLSTKNSEMQQKDNIYITTALSFRKKNPVEFMKTQNHKLCTKSQVMNERSHYLNNYSLSGKSKELQEEEDEKLFDSFLLKKINSVEFNNYTNNEIYNQKTVGENIVQQYYTNYKHLQKIIDKDQYYQNDPNVQVKILEQIEKNNIFPSKLGLFKQNGDENTLKVSYMNFGDKYLSVLGKGLKKINQIKKYYFNNNRLTDKSVSDILISIQKNAKEINLAHNQLGLTACMDLQKSIQNSRTYIQVLDLEDNKLNDQSVSYLLEGLLVNRSLKKLNLSKNYLTYRICPLLKQVLEQNSLQELYLYWNQICGKGGAEIFEGLKENQSLYVLDISSNNLGKAENTQLINLCIQTITEFLQQNGFLVHIDLSNNKFDYQASLEISKALEKNQTIYGFHFTGNIGYVDSRGYLIVNENQEKDIAQLHTQGRINGCKMLENNIKFRENRDKDLQNCCWICEGWREFEFVWTLGVSGELYGDPLFIHFNFEDFRANYFGKNNGNESRFVQQYQYSRMIPPGELQFFFSALDSSEIAQNYQKKVCGVEQIPNVYMYEGQVIDIYLKEINFEKVEANKEIFYKYQPQIKIKPRTKDQVYNPPKKRKIKYKWKFPQSLFAKWKVDNEELIRKCFEFDWKYGKINKIVRNDEDENEIANFFLNKYLIIKNFYKFYASKSPVGDIWAIQNGAFLEFIDKIKIVDNKLIKDADINIKWVATVSSIPQNDKTNPRNPVQGINRYQVMEILVRIAEEKYLLKTKKATSYTNALQLLWEEHLFQEINDQYNPQTWRNQRYWNEQCDTCLKFYKPILEHVYKKFAKLKVKPGQPPFMCLEELQEICTRCGFNELPHFGPQIPLQAYNFSMMTQIDEMNSDRIFQMSLLEFFEAAARIADDVSLEPIEGIRYIDVDWNDLEVRKAQHLGHKLEAFIVRMLFCCCDGAFREKYPKITKSFFTRDNGEEEYDLVSP